MRKYFFASLLVLSTSSWGQTVETSDWASVSPVMADQLGDDPRLIEPTSPILGKALTARIREDIRHPEDIYHSILSSYPQIRNDLHISAITYFSTLMAPLKHYCSDKFSEVDIPKDLSQVEHAAIPISVLLPFHQNYLFNLGTLKITPYRDLSSMAAAIAQEYQAQRYDCIPVKKLEAIENKFKKIFPKRWDKLVDINHDISSPEAAFPRVQYSINGLTQYVFRELMNLEFDKLSRLLRVVYDAEVNWLESKKINPGFKPQFYTHIEKTALKEGFLPREILLAISYSTRNMPSIDVQYGYDVNKALLLEIYFWKFHPIKKLVSKKYIPDTFPNKKMKVNPGLYHYATAALLACDIKLHGYSGIAARLLALASKAGYKFHKLFTESRRQNLGIMGIIRLAKKQGLPSGINAGRYGGAYGLSLCRKHTPKEFWLKNINKPESIPVESIENVTQDDTKLDHYELEDFTPEMEAEL